MLEIISYFAIVIITYIMDCYLFCKLNNEKFRFSKKMIIVLIIASFINAYLNQEYTKAIRIVATNLELIFLLKTLYDRSIVKTLISTLILVISYAVSEMLFVLLFIDCFHFKLEFFNTTIIGVLLLNFAILIITYCIFRIRFILSLSKKIINWQKDNRYVNTVLLIILAFITLVALLYPISTNSNSPSTTFLFVLFILCTIIFVTGFFNEKSENNKLNEDYDTLIDYLKVYEKEINEKSKLQHEFKNQLILIKEMDTSKKVKNYISNLLGEDEETQNKLLLSSLKDVPNGGLKGLIYYKLNHLSEDVELHIHVGSDIDQIVWDKINLNDASKIVGILLDNAIEAINKEDKKYLVLDLDKCDDNLIFTVSNSCTKKIDFDNLDKEGYSTKGKNHGYGLPLLNDIIRKNKNVKIKRELNGIMFSTKIYMKI